MKSRRFDNPILAAVFGLMLAMTSTGVAQQVRSGFGFGPASQQLVDQLNEVIDRECAAVRTATVDDLRTEDEWLTTLMNNAEAKAKSGAKQYFELAFKYRRGSPYENPALKEPTEKAWAEFEDDLLEMQVIEYFIESVGRCVEKQVRLLQGERRILGKWFITCNDPGGILPDGTGHIDLELLTDNSIRASVTQPGVGARIEIFGRMRPSGDFDASTKEGQQPIVHVDGQFTSFDPLKASGSIWFGREVPGYAKLQCDGRWRSQ